MIQLSKMIPQPLRFVTLMAALFAMPLAYANTLINAAGATFPEPIYTKWFSEFHKKNPSAKINYQAIGSGAGIRQLTAGTVDFAASDEPMKADEEAKMAVPVVHIPTVLGAVVISYNLPLEKPLNLTGEVVAQIFMGEIKNWNDERIAKLNAGITLPTTAITAVYRSDGSGTTAVFTDYLAKMSAGFKQNVGTGKAVSWPVGAGAKGNAGVAGIVAQTPGAVGYIELTYAISNKMKFASLQNASGHFVVASEKSLSAAATPFVQEAIKNNFKISITNSAHKAAYPISSFTWLIIPQTWDNEKGVSIKSFLEWALSDSAQNMAIELHYAPLPKELSKAALVEIKKITVSKKSGSLTR